MIRNKSIGRYLDVGEEGKMDRQKANEAVMGGRVT